MCLWELPWNRFVLECRSQLGTTCPTTVCLDYFNEIVPRISMCSSGQHLASHESVCDFLLRKWILRQKCFNQVCLRLSCTCVSAVLVKKGHGTAGVISNALKGAQLPQTP